MNRNRLLQCIGLLLLVTLLGCETVKGMTRDAANTARNLREILGLGRDIKDISN